MPSIKFMLSATGLVFSFIVCKLVQDYALNTRGYFAIGGEIIFLIPILAFANILYKNLKIMEENNEIKY